MNANVKSNESDVTKKCHIISKFFLKKFSNSGSTIYSFNIDRIGRTSNVGDKSIRKKVGIIKDAYNVIYTTIDENDKLKTERDGDLEKQYEKREGKLAREFKSILDNIEASNDRSIFTFQERQKKFILDLLILLLEKVVYGYLFGEHKGDLGANPCYEEIAKLYFSNNKRFIEQLFYFSQYAVGNLDFLLGNEYIRGILKSAKSSYCTCDIPIHLVLDDNDIYPEPRFLGNPPLFEEIKNSIKILYFPISKDYCIYIAQDDVSENEVKKFNNDWVVDSALKYVICSNEDILKDIRQKIQKNRLKRQTGLIANPFSNALNMFYHIAFLGEKIFYKNLNGKLTDMLQDIEDYLKK